MCSEPTKSKPVKQETSHRYSNASPNGQLLPKRAIQSSSTDSFLLAGHTHTFYPTHSTPPTKQVSKQRKWAWQLEKRKKSFWEFFLLLYSLHFF